MSKELWMWLAAGLGHGAVNSGELLQEFPEGANAIYNNLGDERLDDVLTQKQAEKLASSRPEDFALSIANAKAQGVETIAFDEDDYPQMMKDIMNPPLVLFAKGDKTLLNGQLSIGMVGARRPSAYGVEIVKAIGKGVALGGAIIVSGLAAGLDSEAHKAALAVNGPTIACIAFGHDFCYPAANKTLMKIIEKNGLVISEYPLGTEPKKPYFLHRNRLIASLSHGLVVAEARRHSGTMSTVNFAIDYSRDVFAVPGSIFSELSKGTNDMIREGAHLAASASDVLSVYGVELEKDPIIEATKQAQASRPEPAVPAPWRVPIADGERAKRTEKLKEQTMGEALQTRLGGAAAFGTVSGKQAVEAFKQLQDDLPADDILAQDERNRLLDEMITASANAEEAQTKQTALEQIKAHSPQQSLSVGADKISRATRGEDPNHRRGTKTEKKKKDWEKGGLRLFQWDKVDHLDKRQVEKINNEKQKEKEILEKQQTPLLMPENKQKMGTLLVKEVAPILAQEMPAVVNEINMQPTKGKTPFVAPMPLKTSNGMAYSGSGYPAAGAKMPLQKSKTEKLPTPKAEDEKVLFEPNPPKSYTNQKKENLPKDERIKQAIKEALQEGLAETTSNKKKPQKPREETQHMQPKASSAPIELKSKLRTLPSTPQDATSQTLELAKKMRNMQHGLQTEKTKFAQKTFDEEGEENAQDETKGLSENAKRAFQKLSTKPASLDEICENAVLSTGEAMAALTELELAGLSRQLAGRQFVVI